MLQSEYRALRDKYYAAQDTVRLLHRLGLISYIAFMDASWMLRGALPYHEKTVTD